MQAPDLRNPIRDLLCRTPRVGDLMGLCEENYLLLRRLAPTLEHISGTHCSGGRGGTDLILSVLDQAPYTTGLRLTHLFARPLIPEAKASGDGPQTDRILHADPDTRLRVYHDARQVEVLDLRQTALPIYSHYRHPALAAKWKANLFLSKWLGYCLREGHRFPASPTSPSAETARELSPSL